MALSVGDRFDSFLKLQNAICAFEKTNLANFYIRSSKTLKPTSKITQADVDKFKYRAIYYKCKYSDVCKPKAAQSVRKSYSYKNVCHAFITVNFKAKRKVFEVGELDIGHNHDRSAAIFEGLPKQRRLDENERHFVEDMISIKPNMRLLQKEVNAKTGKTMILKDLHNIRHKLKTVAGGDLEAIYEEIKARNDITAEVFVDNNELQGIFIQDDRMRRYFELYPELLLMDATYKLNDRRMPLFLMLVVDGNGESQIAAMFIIKSENYNIISKMLATFKKHNPKHTAVKVILSDKNFADRRAYAEAFENAQLELCIFHVHENFKREVSTQKMGISSDEKKRALAIMHKMVYARKEAEYLTLYAQLCSLNLPRVKEYFEKNWHGMEIRQQWVAYFTNSYQNFLNRTTNRLESINQKLKTVVTKYGTLHSFLKETLDCIQSLSLERDQRTIRSIHRQPVFHAQESVDEFSYRKLLTCFAYTKLLNEKQNIESVVFVGQVDDKLIYKSHKDAPEIFSVDDAGYVCSCPFFRMMTLPCRHVIAFRKERNMNLFAADLCHQRWHKARLPSELLGDINYIQQQKVMSQTEKFRKATETTNKIAEMLSEKSMALFDVYMAALNDVAQSIEEDKIFAINELNENDKNDAEPNTVNVVNHIEPAQNHQAQNGENNQKIALFYHFIRFTYMTFSILFLLLSHRREHRKCSRPPN